MNLVASPAPGSPTPVGERPKPSAPPRRRYIALVAGKGATLVLALCSCIGLTGCFGFLKPAPATARYYLLTPIPASAPTAASADALALGVGQVKLPAYLLTTSLVVRTGTNEVEYVPSAMWAERLDAGLQRVLAVNLSLLLPADRVHLSAWEKGAVEAEVYVTLEQFDVDDRGNGMLVARWRVLSPGGEKVLRAGRSQLRQPGPAPGLDPSGSVGTLSSLVADFSRQLAEVLRETRTPPR